MAPITGIGQDYNKINPYDLKKSDVAAVVAQNPEILNNPFISDIGESVASNEVKNTSSVDTAAIIAENKKKQKQEETGSDVSAVLAMSSQPKITDEHTGNQLSFAA